MSENHLEVENHHVIAEDVVRSSDEKSDDDNQDNSDASTSPEVNLSLGHNTSNSLESQHVKASIHAH